METALGLISISNILELPWLVKGPGLFLIALFLLRAVRCVFSLRLITVLTSLVYAMVFAIILSQAGDAIVQLIGIEELPAQQSLITPACSSDSRYIV